MIRSFICGVVLVLASVVAAQSPPIKGVVVQTSHYDPAKNMVTLTIANVSHKDVTGYNLAIKEIYADGHVNSHELLADYVGRIAFIQEMQGTVDEPAIRQQFGDGLFHSGDTREELVGVRPGLKDIQVVVDVVAYADHTSEASNKDGLQRLVVHRKASIASRQMANDIIKAALADPNDADPAATAAKKIQEQVTIYDGRQHSTVDLETGELTAVAQHISAQKLKRNDLQKYVDKREKNLQTLSPHADLKAGGPQ